MHPGASRHDDTVHRERRAVCQQDSRATGCGLDPHHLDALAHCTATSAEPIGQRQEAFGGVEHAAYRVVGDGIIGVGAKLGETLPTLLRREALDGEAGGTHDVITGEGVAVVGLAKREHAGLGVEVAAGLAR
jgi:hypothetical protein